ncbi:hypothetical protein ACQKMD_16385 [Viridibacillus sp. NPDC096237]|uniref:hypothetical protein n=1 Tax=Viridibacillus sp. NPDC096237 TaxID=3390721 RepID=UPI003D0197FC
MVNNKLKLVKSATAFVIGATVLTGAFAAAGSDTAFAKSSTSVKVSNGKLVNKSTGKVVKGYKTYNKALYKDGKKFTGLYKKTYYKAGKKATGTYKSVYYKAGKAFTGVTNKTYYKAGKKATGTYKNVYYKTGKAYTGVVNKTYYKAGKKATGLYKGVYYKTGKAATGIYNDQLYISGNLSKGLELYKDQLYKDGSLNKGLALFKDQLYKDAALNKGLVEFEGKFYFDAALANDTYTDQGVERAFENGIEVGAKVKAVEAINGTTVKVTFNKAVDKTDAEKLNVVTIEGVSLSAGKLSEDGRTLTLTSSDAIKVTDATVVVNAIKTKADAKVSTEKFVSKITYEDKVAPSILSVEAQTNGTVAKSATIQLSEPVKAGVLVKVDGDYVAVTSFTGTSDKLELTGLNLEAGKTHTLEVINAEDTAGNKVVSISANFTVSVDAAIPAATVSAGASDKEILVTFSKAMNVAKVAGITVKDEALADVKVSGVAVVEGSKDTQFKINVTEDIFKNKDSRTFSVVLPKDMEDKLGNKTTDSVLKVTLTKDTVKPVATGYNVVKDKDGKVESIEINFSEGLKAGSVATDTTVHVAASSIVNANGVLDTDTFANFKSKEVKAGDKKLVFKAATAEAISGQYAISFKSDLVTDQAEASNKSAAFNYTIDFGQGQQATEFVVTKAEASSNVITVTFPEAVKGGAVAGSATDLANYTLGGKPLQALTGTTITLDKDQKVATITLPAESIAKDDKASVFTAANIKNIAGTKTVKSYTGTVDVKDNVAPVLQSAKILDNKTIELTYSEALALTGVNAGEAFKIVQGTDTLVLTAAELKASVASGFENKLVLKIEKGTDTAEVPATPANAEISGASATKVTLTNKDKATADETVNYKVVDNTSTGGKLELQKADGTPEIADLSTSQSFTLNGVTVSIAGAVDGDTFTVKTVKAVAGTPATSTTTLDLTKNITIETLNSASKVVTDKSATKNEHKKEVKVTVAK